MKLNLLSHLRSFLELLKTAEFSKGISFAVAAILPLLIANQFGAMQVGIPMAIGVLLSSPSDVPGSLRRRMIGVGFSAVMAFVGTLLAGYAAMNAVFFVPVLAVLMFSFSMLSVYGFRASLISFSGLFAVVLSLAKVPSESSVLTHSLLVGAGGLWYLIFTVTLHYLTRRKETETMMAEGFELTAQYLDIRNRLLRATPAQREELKKELAEVQSSINEKHEIIREILISRRKNSGRSGVVQKKLLIFMEMVDILELAMANPVNYNRMEQLFSKRQEQLEVIRLWSEMMARQVEKIGEVWSRNRKYQPNPELEAQREKVWQAFEDFEREADLPGEREALLVYRNLLVFKDRQYQKILSIERFLREKEGKQYFSGRTKEAEKFLTSQEYDLKTLTDNLDLKSPIFRHSLRLTVILVAGFFLGRIFHFQNAYWILLTTLVIMRPGYALTRDRFKQRLYGTLIGGAIAVTIVLLVQNTIVYGILAVITLVLAFSMIQRNYKTAAAFITLNVIFVYTLIRPNAFEVIQFRVLDTIIGAALAFLGNKFLWPTWEYTGIRNYISKSITANMLYLQEIEEFYSKKGKLPAAYKLARKEAFLAMGDLSAAFQRMAQEPKTGETDMEQVFQVVSLNQELLSSAASLGTFIKANPTTSVSGHFLNYMKVIRSNLESSVSVLQEKVLREKQLQSEIEKAETYFREKYGELAELRRLEKEQGMTGISEQLREQFQEVQIITHQLRWLLDLSENLGDLLEKNFTN
ncbi:TIGR01666 family membrane protein [Salinimicrobium catena]|uniref:TIGR01666 family membrane protein n=1 Tax=Salinimicrobium catena TaxID=390640 RepID=A0A1H5M4Q4_9FLAO|nr:FUSC family membrane protein [Salinimicrobium catena]SDL18389.1 TIGR01666 family membrane protein [Salinimicrobium catena]SEE84173.1 TIGR01666 family membrane protein [Salinimicrobium catena]